MGGILQRSLACVTNRQAYLLADSVFNRAGVTPAILDALLVSGSCPIQNYKTTTELKDDFNQSSNWIDVKHQLVLAHEQMVTSNFGDLNLWAPNENTGPARASLADLKISESFLSSGKKLWIRYARAGDGERKQKILDVDGSGNITGDLYTELDMDLSPPHGMAAMCISKEEFVSCV